MLKRIEQFDAGIARGEAALATVFLISMILVASLQAAIRNLSGMEVEWATSSLDSLVWVDPFLQKGTLWLAFLGASLATREGRHIGIDIVPRIAPKRVKILMRAVAGFGSSLVSFFLARAFWSAVLVNADERPADFEVWGDEGALHVCDATLAQVTDAGLEMPSVFCAIRSALAGVNVPVETGEAALQLIVPVMFLVMSVRLFAMATSSSLKLATGNIGDDGDDKEPEPEGPPDEQPESEPPPTAQTEPVASEEEE